MNVFPTPTLPCKTILVSLFLLAALVLGIQENRRLSAARAALAAARQRQAALEAHRAAAAAALESAREELRNLRTSRAQTLAAASQAQQALARTAPDSRWATPPADPSEWEPDSPYVWLRKDFLPKLPFTVFSDDGALQPELLPLFSDVLDPAPAAEAPAPPQ